MNNDERKPGDEGKNDKRRQPLKLNKDTLRALSARSGVKAGIGTNLTFCICPLSEGPRCVNA